MWRSCQQFTLIPKIISITVGVAGKLVSTRTTKVIGFSSPWTKANVPVAPAERARHPVEEDMGAICTISPICRVIQWILC